MPFTRDPEKIITEATEKYNRMLDLSLRITDDYTSARRLDVEQLRNLMLQLSVVSFGAVGFSIPIIGSSSVVKEPVLFTFGLFFLSACAIGGLWYSAIGLENSIIGSYKGFKTNKQEVDEAISNQVFLMKNPDKYDEFVTRVEKTVKDLENKKELTFKRDKILYVLLSLLTVGIACIFLSLFPVISMIQNIKFPCVN